MGDLLRGKVAVVTGSGRGIGRGIVMLLAEQGAKVVVNDLGVESDGTGGSRGPADDVVEEIRRGGGEAVASYDSVATMEGGRRIIQTALDAFGRIDILVNNAGVFWHRPFLELTEQEFDSMIQVHLKGHFACTQAALPHMVAQRSGRIINVSSGSAFGSVERVHYSTAKAGVLGFTRSLAREFGRDGITVNALMPAADTRMPRSIPPESRQKGLGTNQAPEDVAPLVAFIASDAAANINGATLAARLDGIVQLICDPHAVQGIYKSERWTAEELAELIPKTFGPMMVNPAPAEK